MNKIFYINLDSREDRKKLCEDQLNSLGWKYNRFSAINHSNGAAGCAMSHLKILEIARDNKLPYVIIFEDDFISLILILNLPFNFLLKGTKYLNSLFSLIS